MQITTIIAAKRGVAACYLFDDIVSFLHKISAYLQQQRLISFREDRARFRV